MVGNATDIICPPTVTLVGKGALVTFPCGASLRYQDARNLDGLSDKTLAVLSHATHIYLGHPEGDE